MILEFILIWMLAMEMNRSPMFWVAFVMWVGYRIIKHMIESSPEMDEK